MNPFWRKCNICKKQIAFGQTYWVCNVSTCNRKRTGLTFCDVGCWDAHVPMMNHRESWAEERKAPSEAEYQKQLEEDALPKKRKPREEKNEKSVSAAEEDKNASAAASLSQGAAPKALLRKRA